MKRFFLIFVFLFSSFALADGLVCKTVPSPDRSDMEPWRNFFMITTVCDEDGSVPFGSSSCFSSVDVEEVEQGGKYFYRYVQKAKSCRSCEFKLSHSKYIEYSVIDVEVCTVDVSVDGWCKSGYSSPIYVPSPSMLNLLNGRPVVRYSCDDPPLNELYYYDSWDDYASNRNPKPFSDLEKNPGGEGSGSGSSGEGPGSGSGGEGSDGDGSGGEGSGQSKTTLEDILQAVNFVNSNSTKSTIDAINFSSDAISRAVRDGIDSSSIGSGGSGGSGSGSGSEGSGSDLEIPEGLLTEDYLNGLFSGFISDAENIDDSEIDSSNVESIDIANLKKTYNVTLLASKQCPAPIPISFSMFGHAYNYYLTFDYLCMFAEVVGTLLLAAAYFSAAFIVARVSRR